MNIDKGFYRLSGPVAESSFEFVFRPAADFHHDFMEIASIFAIEL
jgi:hypothetical protein